MKLRWILLLAAARLSAQSSGVSENVNVRVMDIDVVVTEKDGRPVRDLRRDEFQVRVDRKPVSIDYFAAVQDSSVREPDLTTLSPDLVLNPFEKAGNASVPRHFLIFFDASLSPAGRQRSGEALKELVARMGPSDDAVILAEGGVKVEMLSDWTSNRENLISSLVTAEKARPETLRRLERERQTIREIDLAGRVAARVSRARMHEEEEYREVARMIAHLNEAISLFGGKPGKKIFLDISGGFEIEPGATLLAYAERGSVPTLSFRRDVSAELKSLTERANAMEVTIFTFDARGLIAPGVEASNEPPLAAQSLFAREATQGGLALLAEETGGKAYLTQNRFEGALESVSRDVSSYYSLGVNLKSLPSESAHRIDVAVDRPGLLVRARKNYTVESEDQRIETRVRATLLAETSYADVAVSLKTSPVERDKTSYVLPLRIDVPAHDLTFLPDGDHAAARVAFYFSAINEQGDNSGISRTEQTLTIPLNESRSARPVGIRVPIHLAKGSYRIVVNVRDVESGRMGTARANVKVE
ncbi:MAG: VWA domain-containing protein [Thermoanaerobaculia bacterium]